MAETLEKEMGSGWISLAYLQFQGRYIREARERALARRSAGRASPEHAKSPDLAAPKTEHRK
jgi:hypothetical protein